jgi:hypothetical protein
MPGTTPGQRKENTGMKQPQDRDAYHAQDAGRPPDYVVVQSASAQLRDRIQRTGAALAETQQTRASQITARLPDPPQADREAEP